MTKMLLKTTLLLKRMFTKAVNKNNVDNDNTNENQVEELPYWEFITQQFQLANAGLPTKIDVEGKTIIDFII